jgi:hypothetical protein
LTKVKRTREEMETTLENKKKVVANSPKVLLRGIIKLKEERQA